MFRVAVGQAEDIETEKATRAAIALCREQLRETEAQAGILLCSSNFDHRRMLDMVLAAFAGIHLIGCTTAGDFSSSHGFSDDSITLILFSSDTVEIQAGIGRSLSQDSTGAVQAAAQGAAGKLRQPASLCITLPDLLGKPASKIIEDLYQALQCPVFGGCAARQVLAAQEFPDHPIAQFFGDEILNDAIPILLFGGPLDFAFKVANSWKPVGQTATVTDAAGHEVRTIGGFKALDFYHHYLGGHTNPAIEFPLAVYEPGQEHFYLRAPIHYDAQTGTITFSEAIAVGATVQITESIRDHIIADVKDSAQSLASLYPGSSPAVALAFSCSLRKEALGTRAAEELSVLQEALAPPPPVVGFYGYGEIAPLLPGGKSFLHNATLVTLLLGEADGALETAASPAEGTASRRELKHMTPPQERSYEDLQRENEFLRRKLVRSEIYRKRLEEVRDLNASLHRKLIHEIDEAKRKLERKEEALRHSEEKYRRIVETAGESFLLMDENLTITDVNDAFCRLIGYGKEELIGKRPMDLATEEHRQFILANRDRLLAKDYRRIEAKLIAKDGTVLPVLVHGSILRDSSGDLLGHMAFITDLSDTKKALMLAAQVQKGLLPQSQPRLQGIEIAGRNLPCEEIGGDYYDYLYPMESCAGPLGVVVGDITGHGVDAALLMTAARSFLRTRIPQAEGFAEAIGEMNRHLTLEVFDEGRFMTLFYLVLDLEKRRLHWVRAGHDPALVYHPVRDEFEELKGDGIALGLDQNSRYRENVKTGLSKGQIIAIGTDGIWEAHNRHGEMFGKPRFREIIRRHAASGAEQIVAAVYAEVKDFTLGMRPEDDVTLVVIKVLEDPWRAASPDVLAQTVLS